MAKQLSLNFNNLNQFSWEKYFENGTKIEPCFSSNLGILFEADCLKILPNIKDKIADVIFADPPFNLGKDYGNKSNDSLADSEYLSWCFAWINEYRYFLESILILLIICNIIFSNWYNYRSICWKWYNLCIL